MIMSASQWYETPLSVWDVVKECVTAEKRPLVRQFLSESKLDYCADMRQELDTLLEIWGEIMGEQGHSFPRLIKRFSTLPEPPQQREMLITEIQLLVQNLKEKDGIPLDTDQDILEYATGSPVSQTPTSPQRRYRPHTAPGVGRSEIANTAKNISVFDIEKSAGVLREALQRECDILTEDIEFVRKCVETGHYEEPEPSILELRTERKKLENHLLKDAKVSLEKDTKPTKSTIRTTPKKKALKPTLPSPKKDLPPVRPSSAMQFHSNQEVTSELFTPRPETEHISTRRLSSDITAPPPQLSLPVTPLLGERSHTFPANRILTPPILPLKAKSSPSFFSKNLNNLTDGSLDPDIGTNPLSNSFSRKYGDAECATPDSGVSSRPTSQLGILDSLSIHRDSITSLSTGYSSSSTAFSDVLLPQNPVTPPGEQSERILRPVIAHPTRGHSMTPENFRQLSENVEKLMIKNEASSPTQIPKPPSTCKPENLPRKSFRRIRTATPKS